MIKWFLTDEMCDKCKKVKKYKYIFQMSGRIMMRDGICCFYGNAICNKCAKKSKISKRFQVKGIGTMETF